MSILRSVLCVLLPPLAVLDKGVMAFVSVCILTLLGWIPGIIGAILFCYGMTFWRAFFCVVCPPLAVYDCGGGAIIVTLVLTLFAWVPGIVASVIFVLMRSAKEKPG